MRRWKKWLIAAGVLVVVGPPLVWIGTFIYASRPGAVQTHPASCAKAMADIGWKLPPRADGQECAETSGGVFASAWSGTFRVPRADARTWLLALPDNHDDPVSAAGPDAVREMPDGLVANIVPPADGRIDVVDVEVRWEGQDDAVVTFETHNG